MDENKPVSQEGSSQKVEALEKELESLEKKPVSPSQGGPEAPANAPVTPPVSTPEPVGDGKPGSSRMILWLGIFLLAVSLVAGAAYYLGSRGVTPEPTPSPTPEITPTPTPDPTADWRTIIRKFWEFKVPSNWNFWACDNNNYNVFVGSKISEDQIGECAFDGSPGLIQVGTAESKNKFGGIVEDSDPNDSFTISEKSTIKVDGEDAVIQREVETEGQGRGDRYVVYITSKLTSIVLHDAKEKDIFDQILFTFKFTE